MIKEMLHAYAASLEKTWAHDRATTIGASEIGACARKTWFAKHDAPQDSNYVDNWGARLRGTFIEDYFWVPGLRATLPEGVQLLYAGDEQTTLVDEYLSATTDGLMVWPDGHCINLDCKSVDPRVDLQKEKTEHTFQVQTQMGLIRLKTEYKPEQSIVSYIDASFFDKIVEFTVPFSPRIFTTAQKRAKEIMTAHDALDVPPEGKMAGGSECKYCAWASHCADIAVASVPLEETALSDNLAGELKVLRDEARDAAELADEWKAAYATKTEQIKQFLREHNTRRFKGDGWGVSWSAVKPKLTLDIAAAERAGLDLSPFYKPGKPSERLTIT